MTGDAWASRSAWLGLLLVLYKIELDSTAQTATLIGQASAKIVVPWTSFWP